MKRWVLAVMLLGIATATVVPLVYRGTRGVHLVKESDTPSTRVDPKQSAALFVGVSEFAEDVERVPFAVDDAVDLAYAFAFDRHVRLVPPRRVVLILSGRSPEKRESQERLRALRGLGADVRFHADAADILVALREQAALAGRDGLLIVSIAAHGFLRDGNSYILGASSRLRDPSTMLSTADMFETMTTSKAQRSLVFVDACRERMVKGSRSVLASAIGVAPRIHNARGQAVFYAAAAGGTAYDDFAARNGVFTRTVIDGIKCGAAKPRGAVTVDTLAGYVERNVQRWIRVNRDPDIGSATQVSIDGAVQNMALAQCVPPPPGPCPARVSRDGTIIRAFSAANEQLWQYDARTLVTQVDKLDLDADGVCETIFATADTITALDVDGKRLWSVQEHMTLTALLTDHLLRQPTFEIAALWSGAHGSRLATYAATGTPLGVYDSSRRLDRIAIGRPTNLHAPRIVATSGNTLLLFDRRKLKAGKPLWSGPVTPGTITSVEIVHENDENDIAVTTSSGGKVVVDFKGHELRAQGAHFERINDRAHRSMKRVQARGR